MNLFVDYYKIYVPDLELPVLQCEKLTQVSPENVTVTLPRSEAGSVTSDLSCSTTGLPFATAVCEVFNGTASWQNITWNPCQLKQDTNHTKNLTEYAKMTINKENADEIAANLFSETKNPVSLSNQDVTIAAVVLEKITDLAEVDIPVMESVSATVSNLMSLDPSSLGTFP